MSRGTLCLALLLAASVEATDFAVNAGAIEVLALPGPRHVALYPYVGVSWAFVHDRFAVIPELALEYSPELARVGLVGSVTVDFPIGHGWGLDFDVALIHDEPGFHIDQSVFYLGGGGGASFTTGPWTLSPFLNVFRGLQTHDWSLVPGINLARAL
jgi:hypothetical protein